MDTLKFQELINEDGSVDNLLKFCAQVLYPEVASEKLKKLTAPGGEEESDMSEEDDFFAPSPELSNQNENLKFEEYCKMLSMLPEDELEKQVNNVKMTFEDKLSIFSVDSKYSG